MLATIDIEGFSNLPHHRGQTGEHTITAADPLPDDVHTIREAIRTRPKGALI